MRFQTLAPEWGIAVIRLTAGLIIFVAALEKFFGGGFDGFTRVVTTLGIPLPQLWGIFIPLLELSGGALVLVGLGARWVAALFVVEYFVTTFLLKVPRQPPFGGWDSLRIDLMLLASSVMLVLCGPGALALDTMRAARAANRNATTVSASAE
jgi:putative oxidoreductase